MFSGFFPPSQTQVCMRIHIHIPLCVCTHPCTHTHTHTIIGPYWLALAAPICPLIYILIYSLKHWIFDESHGRIQWGLCELVWALKAVGGKWQALAILDHLSLPRLGLGALRGETGGLLSPSCSLTRREPNC